MNKVKEAYRGFGLFNATNTAAVQFNSILVRIIIGSLAHVPPEIIALVTAIEFFLNLVLEVPFGRLSDKLGRVKMINIGQSLILVGIICTYAALLVTDSPLYSRALFVALGICIGLGKPLMSGSVEAFYQDSIESLCENEEELKEAKDSLTLSKTHGKYYSLIAVFASLLLIVVFHYTVGAEHVFIFAILFRAISIALLKKDYKKYGDKSERTDSKEHDISKILSLLKISLKDSQVNIASTLRLIAWAMITIIAGYLILTIGRLYKTGVEGELTQYWLIIAAFYIGFSGLGNLLSGRFLPSIVKRISSKSYLISSFVLILLSSALSFFIFETQTSFVMQFFTVVLFTSLFSVGKTALMSKVTNIIMSKFENKDTASILSMHSMPSYGFTVIYSYYLMNFRDGAPTIQESFVSVIILSILGIIISSFLGSSKDEN